MVSAGTFGAVALGGAIGAVMRYGVSLAALRFLGGAFPYATLAANVSGSFVMGLIASTIMARPMDDPWRAFLGVGILGAFTTFSTFSLDAALLARDRPMAVAAVYVGLSVVLSLGGLALGLMLARRMAGVGG